MGGLGSGNRYRWDKRSTTDEYQRLDVREFHRKGLLFPWSSGTSRCWWRGERLTGSIGWVVEGEDGRPAAVRLAYRLSDGDIAYRVPLTWTLCHYGGQRPWFLCPGDGCGRRVAVLFGGRYFLCRHCHNLAYESTREAPHSRYLRKTQKIRTRLGGSASIYERFPEKPKGMHWRTYWRLQTEAYTTELASWQALADWISKLDARLARHMKE
jgi:hypothetical protein